MELEQLKKHAELIISMSADFIQNKVTPEMFVTNLEMISGVLSGEKPEPAVSLVKEKEIIEAYVKIRSIDHTIPDETLDFMKTVSINYLRYPKGKELQFSQENATPEFVDGVNYGIIYMKNSLVRRT